MDRKIDSGKNKKKIRQIVLIAAAALFAVVTIYVLSFTGGKYKITGERIRIAKVEHGRFDDIIAIQGRVEPIRSFFLDAVEGGTVQEVFVEPGAMVEKGQPLLRLSNTNLMLDFMNRETQIVEQINNLRSMRLQMELNERNIREQVLDIAFERETMERQYRIDTSLYASEVIARQEFENSMSRYKYLEKKQKLLESSFKKDETYRDIQLKRIDQSVEMMERNLQAIRQNLENLTVKAPISGQLTSLNAETGQSKMPGQNLGRIDVLDGFVVKALVDEHYLSRVQKDQTATFTHAGKEFNLVVSKIYPEVTNNQFEVEFEFPDSIPSGIRRGQTLGLRLALSNSIDAIIIPRGAFYSSSGGKWVYVVTGNRSEAVKRTVKLGRQNPDYIEVLDGLDPGEEIITSSYDTYGDYSSIIIN